MYERLGQDIFNIWDGEEHIFLRDLENFFSVKNWVPSPEDPEKLFL